METWSFDYIFLFYSDSIINTPLSLVVTESRNLSPSDDLTPSNWTGLVDLEEEAHSCKKHYLQLKLHPITVTI